MIIDRQFLGDVGLAVLLALPTATLARPSATMLQAKTTIAAPQMELAAVKTSPLQSSRFGLPE